MKFKNLLAFGLVLAMTYATSAQAAAVVSMTIEEIGSTGVGSSAAGTGGGIFAFYSPEPGNGVCGRFCQTFVSMGTTDGMIILGTAQGNGAFATPIPVGGLDPAIYNSYPNTLGGVTALPAGPTGDISGNTLSLDLAGWGLYWSPASKQLQQFPDSGSLVTAVQQIDATHYYYTADWSHIVTVQEDAGLTSFRADWHLEGIATVVPVPAAIWLLGSGLVGLVGVAKCCKNKVMDALEG